MRRGPLRSVCLLLLAVACASEDPPVQKSFESPEEAVAALLDLLERDDRAAVPALFGPEFSARLVTSDWDADRDARLVIAKAIRESHHLETQEDGAVLLIAGAEDWPFPIPLAETPDDRWHFDTAEGIEVLIDRRVGRNELSALRIVDAYVDAQIAYARQDRDGDGVREYAQHLASSAGQRDGLYWEAGPDEPPSPFGPLVQRAEGYLEHHDPGDPIRGYYFRILTRQGPNPPGGAYDYIINDNMIAGFGLVAYPADYPDSGIMTFVVSHQGRIYQKDLGPFRGMDSYDPDDGWAEVTPE